jgi:hypothetical protein
MNVENDPRRRAIDRGRVVIHASCSVHGSVRGFANLAVRKLNGGIELDPHVTGACVLTLNEGGASVLRDALTWWLA